MSIIETRFYAMGCQMLAALDTTDAWNTDPLTMVPDWFETWEQQLSRFRDNSELSELNRSSGRPFRVSPVLWEVFQEALQAEERSRGWVTPTVYDALVESGYANSFVEGAPVTGAAVQTAARPAPPLQAVQVDALKRSLTLPEGVHLDFGGIAKGWAAEQALRKLEQYGPALVDAGGDIAIGMPFGDGQFWPVGVAEPFKDGEFREILMLSNCGVATSGRDYRRWQRDGAWQHHLIDPHTGQPSQTDVLSATVVAPTTIEAEIAAKVLLLSGHVNGFDWLEDQPAHVGMVILENGQRIYSRHFNELVWREE